MVEADIESEGVLPESWVGNVVDGPFLSYIDVLAVCGKRGYI